MKGKDVGTSKTQLLNKRVKGKILDFLAFPLWKMSSGSDETKEKRLI